MMNTEETKPMTQFYFRHGTALSETDNTNVVAGVQGESGYLTRDENCPRCGGAGGSAHWRPDGGVCYQCRGGRTISVTRRVFTADRLEVLNIATQKKEDKRIEEQAAKDAVRLLEFVQWGREHKDLLKAIQEAKGDFFQSLASQLRDHRTLSERQIEAAARIIKANANQSALDIASTHVGEIKERIEFEATVEFTKEFEGFYGSTTIIKLRDLEGNVFTWFASGPIYDHDVKRGDRVSIKGTVKKHDDYQGTKQTILTRCKITKFEVMEADEAATQEDIA